ncbi:hypothetical protein ASF54_06840 [Frondihabitans sp. Leaf304]|nr:hypothetical protein ASF54_06840 [Frondihabitans sp. Leaf304]
MQYLVEVIAAEARSRFMERRGELSVVEGVDLVGLRVQTEMVERYERIHTTIVRRRQVKTVAV